MGREVNKIVNGNSGVAGNGQFTVTGSTKKKDKRHEPKKPQDRSS